MSFTVTDTRQIERMTPGGGAKVVYKVHLTTGNGATGSVEVSSGDWTPEKLRGILETEADRLDLAFDLSE